jgi:hypothetical protein
MKISNIDIHHSPDMVLADLLFGDGLVRPAVRIDEYCDALLDCLNQLDRDGVYTFFDPRSQSCLRLVRNGEEVLVHSDASAKLPVEPRKMKYAQLRAGILVVVDMYRDQLAESVPSHPETHRVQARLDAIDVT